MSELVALPILFGIGDVFLGVLDLAGQLRPIELIERHCHVGEHGQSLRIDLGKAAIDDDLERSILTVKRQDARPHRGDERRMAGEHAEVALRTRYIDLLDVAGKQESFRRNKIEVKAGHHTCSSAYAASAASFLPFSTASSMVPTM